MMIISQRKTNNDDSLSSTTQSLYNSVTKKFKNKNHVFLSSFSFSTSTSISPKSTIDMMDIEEHHHTHQKCQKHQYTHKHNYDMISDSCNTTPSKLYDIRTTNTNNTKSNSIKLLIGVIGIYITYLYYGTLQEEVYTYPNFHYVWYVQVIESLVNMAMAHIGRLYTNHRQNNNSSSLSSSVSSSKNNKNNNKNITTTTSNNQDNEYTPTHLTTTTPPTTVTTNKNRSTHISHSLFIMCGTTQICSKSLTSMSLNSGLSYPIATLAKSSRMAPVMIGQLILGNSKYTFRDYLQVLCIILGTAILGLSKSQYSSQHVDQSTLSATISNATTATTTVTTTPTAGGRSSIAGINLIMLSLVMDGITGGLQKRIKEDAKANGETVKSFDFMYYTNLYMFIVATIVAITNNDLQHGYHSTIIMNNIELTKLIGMLSLCSAAGQSFIYFTIANFDPLVCSTVTTTRKIISVLLSIWYRGHVLNHQGWSGILIAFLGIVSELQHKFQRAKTRVIEKKSIK